MFQDYSIKGKLCWRNTIIDTEELKTRVSQYAGALAGFADGDSPVVLHFSRGPEAVICMLALLESGIPFLNIDKLIPEKRMQYMIEEVNAKVVIHDGDFELSGITAINVNSLGNMLCRDMKGPGSSSIAYYLFTSGTTGRPKAVPILRTALANFFDGMDQIFHFQTDRKILNLTSYSFDIVFLELLFGVYTGLCVVLTSDEEAGNIRELQKMLVKNEIQIMQLTPSRLKMFLLVDKDLKCLSAIEFILVGGEAFPKDLLEVLQKKTTARIFNMYGPTETTIWSCVADLTTAKEINIGKPILNTNIYILDENNVVLGNNVEGEIAISGAGLSNGYYGNDEATHKAFVEIEDNGANIRVYKTGDIGMRDNEGVFFCYGRRDNQIKLNGHRIEVDDIDSNLKESGYVIDAVTCMDNQKNQLITFYKSDKEISTSNLISELSERLPNYMVPKVFHRVDDFEYTVSGKTNRKKMLELFYSGATEDKGQNSEELSVEKKVLHVFHENKIDNITVDSIVDDVVADSVSFVEIVVALEEVFDFEFDVDYLDMGKFKSIKDIIEYVKQNSSQTV